MVYFGYIEGYYGRELTFSERKRIIDSLAENGCNSYVMASKEDPYHRLQWRTTPPTEYLNGISALISYGKAQGVTVIPAISPGLTYDYSDSDRSILTKRLRSFINCGASTVALLMDDLPLELPTRYLDTTLSLGELHGTIVSELVNSLPNVELLFCPTLYTDELLGSTKQADLYLQELYQSLPEEIGIFWTGKNTIAESIDHESCKMVIDQFGDRVIFWDNIYANDYATTRLFVGPFEKRDFHFVANQSHGIMINPTGMIETDLLLIRQIGMWIDGEECTISEWYKVANEFGIPSLFTDLLPWFSTPFSFPSLDDLPTTVQDPFIVFETLIVQWQSPLKREWYPYLHRFFTELKLHFGYTGEEPWLNQRFLPITAQQLKDVSLKQGYSIL